MAAKTRTTNRILLVLAAVATVILLSSVTPASAQNGEALVNQKCTLCHTLDRVAAKGATNPSETDWKALVDRMKAKGCPVTDQEQVEIVKYLVGKYSAATPSATPTATPVAQPTEQAKPAANSTPKEQAQTGAEDWLFPLAGVFMIGSGFYLRRKSEEV